MGNKGGFELAINKSKILRGDPIVINEKITLRQPTINEIIDFDEGRFLESFIVCVHQLTIDLLCSLIWV